MASSSLKLKKQVGEKDPEHPFLLFNPDLYSRYEDSSASFSGPKEVIQEKY